MIAEPIGENRSSHSPQSEPIDGDAPGIDWHGEAWQGMGWEAIANYITACGHERHRKTKQASSPPGMSGDGARNDEGTQGETMSEAMGRWHHERRIG